MTTACTWIRDNPGGCEATRVEGSSNRFQGYHNCLGGVGEGGSRL